MARPSSDATHAVGQTVFYEKGRVVVTYEELDGWSDYQGMTACPADFDEFWAARMAEADEVPLQWHIEPSEIAPFATCEYLDLWFVGMGGARLYAKYLRPTSDGPLPLVLQFHGYPGASRSWFEQSSFAGMGCALIALDNPGQGGRSQDVGGFMGTTVSGHLVAGLDGDPRELYYVRLYQDIRILCRIVAELGRQGQVDLSRVYVNGASQGGGMGLACAALNPGLVARAAILYPFLSDMRKVYELGLDEIAYEGLRYYARWFDPDGTREDEWFGRLAYYETNHFSHLVRCPVMFGTGLADTIVPPETQCATYNGLSCACQRFCYEGRGHEEIEDFDDRIIDFFDGRRASYQRISLSADDGATLSARLVAPAGDGPHPLVLLFGDVDRDPRGWHHMTRYVATGHAVLQLENRAGASVAVFPQMRADALAAYDAAVRLPQVDTARVVTYGEGVGGALALAVAASRPVSRAVALNPYPLDDLVDSAPSIACPVLLGTGCMDELADPARQTELAHRLPAVVHKRYPKYAHERINAFENEFLSFING